MKKLIIPVAVLAITFAACQGDAGTSMTDEQINAKADSIVGEQLDDLNREANEDLDRRMSIDVKLMADSIVEAETTK